MSYCQCSDGSDIYSTLPGIECPDGCTTVGDDTPLLGMPGDVLSGKTGDSTGTGTGKERKGLFPWGLGDIFPDLPTGTHNWFMLILIIIAIFIVERAVPDKLKIYVLIIGGIFGILYYKKNEDQIKGFLKNESKK